MSTNACNETTEPNPQNPRSHRTGRIIVILGMLSAFAPLSTDMYLAGFDLISDHFHAPDGAIEKTLSVFFLGLAVGQAIYGPLIDRFGRRKPLLVGVAIYLVSTTLCLVTSHLGAFVLFRFFQAIGGCSGMIVGRAIIKDLFDERESARALSLVITVVTLAPVLAPAVGGVVISIAGWKAVFVLMLAFGLLCAVLAWKFIPETLAPKDRKSEGPKQIVATWWHLLSNRAFLQPVIVGGLVQACMFAFITGSPFVFMTLHHASPKQYGLLFALIACSLVISAQLNRAALKYRSPEFLLGASLIVNLSAGVLLVLSVSTGSLVLMMIPLWFAIGSLGFVGANAAAIAMESSGKHAGSGSSLVGIFQFTFAFAISMIVAATQNGTAYPMAITILACGLAANLIWRGIPRQGLPPISGDKESAAGVPQPVCSQVYRK